MALKTELVQKLSQSLLMTPQLRQAIELLQLGRLEYKEAIEKELLENPILEEAKESEDISNESQNGVTQISNGSTDEPQVLGDSSNKDKEPSAEQGLESKVDWEDYLESFGDPRGAAVPRGVSDQDDRPSLEATVSKTQNLYDYILSQIRLADIQPSDESIVLQIIGNIDKNGYLCCSYDEIANACGCSPENVERVCDIIKSLDPPGIGARDLTECLLIQLTNLGLGDGLEAKIVRYHLDKVEKRKYDVIAKVEQVAIEEVYRAVTAIQNLEPRPGRAFNDDTIRYIVPDIYVYKVGREYVISLNEDGLPKLRVSPFYLQLLKDAGDENLPNRTYLTERLKAASWLIKSIHQRQHTIYRVTESIVKFQKEFLDYGISRLKPLVLKDVADDIGMHESTVSRVTTNKYVHTPQGVFELKFFFSTGIKTSEGDVSSSSIKEKIKNIISSESSSDPISDQRIVELLVQDNIKIARRTVAKYRENLGILSSSRRKKHF